MLCSVLLNGILTIIVTRTSVLADALKTIHNAEKAGKRQVLIRPASKVIIRFLRVIQKHGKYSYSDMITGWLEIDFGCFNLNLSFNLSGK